MERAYRFLKKSSILLFIGAMCSVGIFWFCMTLWSGGFLWSWTDMELEYMGKVVFDSYSNEADVQDNMIANERLNQVFHDSYDGTFYIRNEEDWEYVCGLLKIEGKSIELDFSDYYIVSINKKIIKMEYINKDWAIESHGRFVRRELEEEDSQDGIIYVYRMKRKVDFS